MEGEKRVLNIAVQTFYYVVDLLYVLNAVVKVGDYRGADLKKLARLCKSGEIFDDPFISRARALSMLFGVGVL